MPLQFYPDGRPNLSSDEVSAVGEDEPLPYIQEQGLVLTEAILAAGIEKIRKANTQPTFKDCLGNSPWGNNLHYGKLVEILNYWRSSLREGINLDTIFLNNAFIVEKFIEVFFNEID